MTPRIELGAYLNVFLEDPSIETFDAISEGIDPDSLPLFLDLTCSTILEQRDPSNFDLLLALNEKRNLEHKKMQEQIDRLRITSTIDELTGLPNRRGFYQQMESLLSIALRKKSPMALTFLDIDHFKFFNDTYGHKVGDEALIQFGDFFRKRLRDSDLVARFGGEEFVLGLYDPTFIGSIERIHQFGQDINEDSLSWKYSVPDVKNISFSAGLYWFIPSDLNLDKSKEQIDNLLAKADNNLYVAKNAGRNALIATDEKLPTNTVYRKFSYD